MSIKSDIESYGRRLRNAIPNAGSDVGRFVDALVKLAKEVDRLEQRVKDLESGGSRAAQ